MELNGRTSRLKETDGAYDKHQHTESQLLYTVQDAARLMSVSPATVYNMMNRGEIPFIRGQRTRVRRISRDDLEQWIRSHRHG